MSQESTVRQASPNPIYVGYGLKKRTYEDCVREGLNPNGNDEGEFRNFSEDSKNQISSSLEAQV